MRTGYKRSLLSFVAWMRALVKFTARGWGNCVRFCRGNSMEPWHTPGRIGWGELMLKSITHVHSVIKLHPSSITGEVAAIRVHRIVAGASDFTTHGVRRKQLLKSFRRKSPASRKPPIGSGMLLRFCQRLKHSAGAGVPSPFGWRVLSGLTFY